MALDSASNPCEVSFALLAPSVPDDPYMPMPLDTETWVRVLTFVPILACSAIGFAMALAKWLKVRGVVRSARRLMPQVRRLIADREYGSALAVARADGSLASMIIEQALAEEGRARRRITARIEGAWQDAVRQLNHGLGGIALIATLGPLFGLLGTVVGIAIVFNRLAGADGLVSPGQLAGGIGTALYTTIAGIVVGICALVSHRWLAARCDDATAHLERMGRELLDLISEDDA